MENFTACQFSEMPSSFLLKRFFVIYLLCPFMERLLLILPKKLLWSKFTVESEENLFVFG